ncbi:MAG TPA: hypothetical protein VEB66_11615 [Opitutaceae bacterium]|nr:hypothetical protein [Opitutaceae bacterium]
MKKLTEKELEQFVHAALRSLPDRKAPGTLEARVLAAVERQAAIAWWHKGWAYWPSAVRAAFLAVATAVSGAIVFAAYAMFAGLDTAAVMTDVSERFAGVTQLFTLLQALVDLCRAFLAGIPPLWLYGGLAMVGALYASLFGLGAFAYRTLYRTP